jgi:hypothetical protein
MLSVVVLGVVMLSVMAPKVSNTILNRTNLLFRLTTFRITIRKCYTQHNYTQHVTLSIMTLSKMTLSKMTFSIIATDNVTMRKYDYHHNYTYLNKTQHSEPLYLVSCMLSVVVLSVTAPKVSSTILNRTCLVEEPQGSGLLFTKRLTNFLRSLIQWRYLMY